MRTAGRAIALVLMGCWLAPGAAALAAAVHVELHHHGSAPEAAARELVLRLAQAARHGHSHELTTPEHDHLAVRGERFAAGAAPAANLPAEMPGAGDRSGAETSPPLPPPERPPPRPLFALHCSLLR